MILRYCFLFLLSFASDKELFTVQRSRRLSVQEEKSHDAILPIIRESMHDVEQTSSELAHSSSVQKLAERTALEQHSVVQSFLVHTLCTQKADEIIQFPKELISEAGSADGKGYAAIGENRQELTVWRVMKGVCDVTCAKEISTLAWSPDSTMLALLSENIIEVYDFEKRKLVASIAVQKPRRIAWCTDNRRVAVTSTDLCCIWDIVAQKVVMVQKDSPVLFARYDGGLDCITYGAQTQCLQIWHFPAADTQLENEQIELIAQIIQHANLKLSVDDRKKYDTLSHRWKNMLAGAYGSRFAKIKCWLVCT